MWGWMEREPAVPILHSAADGQIPASGGKERGGIGEKWSVGGVQGWGWLCPAQPAAEVPDLSQITLHYLLTLLVTSPNIFFSLPPSAASVY